MAEILKGQLRHFLWAGVVPFPLLSCVFLAMILLGGWQNFSDSVKPYGLAHLLYQASLGLVVVCALIVERWLIARPQRAYFVTIFASWVLQLVGFAGMGIYAIATGRE